MSMYTAVQQQNNNGIYTLVLHCKEIKTFPLILEAEKVWSWLQRVGSNETETQTIETRKIETVIILFHKLVINVVQLMQFCF